jgi:hypothetical protein
MNHIGLNAVRAIDILTALGFCYLAHLARRDPFATDIRTAIQLLPVVPFVLAFIWLTREPTASQWLAILAIHQALALVILALAAILLVGLPDTKFACAYLAIAGALQLLALAALRRVAPALPKMSRGHTVL